MLHDVGREGWLRKEKGHALTRHTPFRTLSPLGCIQGVPWYSEQEQRVRPFLDPTTDDKCATHPHPVLRLVYRGRRREFSRYLISFSLISNHLLPKGICLHHKALRGGSKGGIMTLGQIRESTKETLSVIDVAEALGTNPQTIRNQAQADPIKLGFPVICLGARVIIPRMAFLYFLEYGRPTGG